MNAKKIILDLCGGTAKPVKVEFYTKDGEKVVFKAEKQVTKPVRIEFYSKKDKKK